MSFLLIREALPWTPESLTTKRSKSALSIFFAPVSSLLKHLIPKYNILDKTFLNLQIILTKTSLNSCILYHEHPNTQRTFNSFPKYPGHCLAANSGNIPDHYTLFDLKVSHLNLVFIKNVSLGITNENSPKSSLGANITMSLGEDIQSLLHLVHSKSHKSYLRMNAHLYYAVTNITWYELTNIAAVWIY